MSAIGPGDFVEALRCYPPQIGFQRISRGAIYVVSEVIPPYPGACSECGEGGGVALRLEGDKPSVTAKGVGWCPCGFRPIYRPKSSLIEGLLKPADAPADLQGVDA